jgi:hypothetical protein
MATEGSWFNPTAVLVHLIAIALGVYLGWTLMEAISPELPDSVEPGVTSTAEIPGDAAESLFRSPNLQPALAQVEDQLGAGEGLVRLHLEPGTIETEARTGDGLFQPSDVPVDAPVMLTHTIDSERGGSPIGLGEISYMELVATERGPRWYVQLDIDKDIGPPPWSYGAPLDGEPLTVGPGPPEPRE